MASLPPSSSTLGISFLPHASAMRWPVATLPVKKHFVRRGVDERGAQFAGALENLHEIRREFRARRTQIADQGAGRRRQLRRLQQHGISAPAARE